MFDAVIADKDYDFDPLEDLLAAKQVEAVNPPRGRSKQPQLSSRYMTNLQYASALIWLNRKVNKSNFLGLYKVTIFLPGQPHMRHPMDRKRVFVFLCVVILSLTACDFELAEHIELDEDTPINIAPMGVVTVSNGDWNRKFAIDDNPQTWWSADDFAPQWIEMKFNLPYLVGRIELTVAQVRTGPGTHYVALKRGDKPVDLRRFDSELMADSDVLSWSVDPPQLIDRVRVLTTSHEGWVAWRELRILLHPDAPFWLAATGLVAPTFITHANDNSGRLFVLEKEGRIRIVKNGILLETPFLDIQKRVNADYHKGLLGLAFPPNYRQSGHFYVSYSTKDNENMISRFSVSLDHDVADPESEKSILTFNQPADIHTGGTIVFHPENSFLYIGAGDGLDTEEFLNLFEREPGSFHGAILRIDVADTQSAYSVPVDNPFVDRRGWRPEIWVHGLRNPWGFAFDRESGGLFIPDTGMNLYEEVNYQAEDSSGGENYGWPSFEGQFCHDPSTENCRPGDYVPPAYIYTHEDGCAIVGGAVVKGIFYFADFCRGSVWDLKLTKEGWLGRKITKIGAPISSIGTGEDGTIYAVGYADGNIYQINPPRDFGN